MEATTVTTTTTTPRRNMLAWTVMVLVVALWVFVVFFLDGILANIAREKLSDLVNSSTHGEYQLNFTEFTYHRGVVHALGTDIRRIGYRADEHGTTLRDLGIDSTFVTGISPWEVIFGKPIALSVFRTFRTTVYLCTIEDGRSKWKLLPPYVAPPPSPPSNFSLTFDSVLIPGITMYGQDGYSDRAAGIIAFSCENFSYDSKSKAVAHLTAEHFALDIPWIQYADSSASYYVRAAQLTNKDSLFTLDTAAYANSAGTTAFRGSGIRAEKIDLAHVISGKGLSMRALSARSWGVHVTTTPDTTQRPPSTLPWQDQIAKSVGFPITVDSLALNGGALDVNIHPASAFNATGLSLTASKMDFDTGAPANRPGFARALTIAAASAQYSAKGTGVQAKNIATNIPDSVITAGNLIYSPSGIRKGKSPIALRDLRIDGIYFDSLLSGSAVRATSVSARGWNISELPAASKSKQAKKAKTSKSIWDAQHQLAESIAMPVRIGRIDLTDGTVRVASPTILADRASIDVTEFNLDSTKNASEKLLFSKDVDVRASRFEFADKGKFNEVDLRGAHSRLSRRSISAGRAEYTSRSTFEPTINHTAYRFNNLDLAGIDFNGLLDNKRIALASMNARSWEIERSLDTATQPQTAPPKKTPPGWTELITVGHASLPNGTVVFLERDTNGFSQTLHGKVTKLDISQFHFLPPKGKRPRLGFDQVVCVMPTFSYAPLDGFYSFEIRNLNGNLHNSIITMDSLAYSPKYSEDEFAALHKYARGRTDFRLAPVHITGIDTKRLIAGESIDVQDFDAPTVWVDYYKDSRKPADPTPSPAVMPNDIVRKLNIPITINKIQVEDGHIQIREHTVNSAPAGNFTFDSIKIAAEPITLDSASPLVDTPTRFDMAGTFIAQAPVEVKMVYPLHDSSLNLSVDGTVGPFDLKQLNQFLVNAERVEVTNGQFHHADIKLNINGGTANTTVVPIYDHFKIKVLPPDPNDPPDLMEGLKTFLANLIVLRDDNPDEKGGPPKVGETTLTRQAPNEYFQFLWFAIRKSLGAVVGGMK